MLPELQMQVMSKGHLHGSLDQSALLVSRIQEAESAHWQQQQQQQQQQPEGQQSDGMPYANAGDWSCRSCGDLQFSRNKECRMCGAPRPLRIGVDDTPAGAAWNS